MLPELVTNTEYAASVAIASKIFQLHQFYQRVFEYFGLKCISLWICHCHRTWHVTLTWSSSTLPPLGRERV